MPVTRYQVEPDFRVGQAALHDAPLTVADTVRKLRRPSLALTELPVEVPDRRFTPEHAGT